MKLRYLILVCFLSTAILPPCALAQDSRTQQTKVADVLALLPARDKAGADRLFKDLLGLNDEGLQLVTGGVLPNGQEEGVAERYAISLLTHHAASNEERARIETAYLKALAESRDTEVQAYFIENLKVIGTSRSVSVLAEKINDNRLMNQAISALVSIGSPDARTVLLSTLERNENNKATPRLIQALGELKHVPAVPVISRYAANADVVTKKHALWSLALIADPVSYNVLLQSAKSAQFKNDASEATHAVVEYIHQLSTKANRDLAIKASQEVLSNTLSPEQQHFRLAALKAFAVASPDEAIKILVKELNRFDPLYQKEVLKVAALNANDASAAKQWKKVYRKSTDLQPEILSMLASANRTDAFADEMLLPALQSKNKNVRIAAAEAISYSENKKFLPNLSELLLKANDEDEIQAAKNALLRMMDEGDTKLLATRLGSARPENQAAIISILADRRAVENFEPVFEQTSSSNLIVREAAFGALANLSSSANTKDLLTKLSESKTEAEIKAVQSALVTSIDKGSSALVNDAYSRDRARVLPLLPYLNDGEALNKVKESFQNGNDQEKAAAFAALLSWQDHHAARTLLAIRRDRGLKQYHDKAFQAYVEQTGKSGLPDDQRLLMLNEAMSVATTSAEKTSVIRAVGNLRSFLALVFVSKYLDDKDLNRAASRSVMQIALPTADARPGLTGSIVRNTLQKILDKLEGQDSQYEVIDIQTYLANMPYTKGYESIFNGEDLSGWQGLVENPIARSRMSQQELAKKQQEANEKLKESWSVKDGAIYFTGKGDNLCTIRPYGDFEMLVDWKISRDGDSGIYLRGSPQVQIWDPWGKEAAAKVGSGGLYNNQKYPSKPLVVADNRIGEWNTFYIKMTGDKVTVHLNGVVVVDNVVMENYWDRSLPIFPEEAIELQAHGNELAFRNIYVREPGGKPYELSAEEKEEGFELLFNGKDLENWMGNKTEYVVEDNAIAIYPAGKGHGNLFTEKEYSDFIFRFEFQLTPGANNGLGIHAPLSGDAAYEGKEIQILDDTAPVYANLEPYQYHGSVYGIIPAKRGSLKPVGEWNVQEVYVKGDHIRVSLNGNVIVDGDLKKAAKNGAMDKKEHTGLNKNRGHIGFLGHGTVVRFRNIRIKDLTPSAGSHH